MNQPQYVYTMALIIKIKINNQSSLNKKKKSL